MAKQEDVKAPAETPAEPVQEKQNEKKILTWQEKLEKGLPLNDMDEVKADADFNFKQRQRELEEKKRFEALKSKAQEQKGDK